MSSVFGKFLRVSTFGESHGPGLGVVVDGLPPGLPLAEADVQRDLDRRRPGASPYVTARKEPDRVEMLSGLAEGKTLGSPVAMLIRNQDARSKDYKKISGLFRPGHADYTYFKKYGIAPQPGGGRSSGRETAARVAAGAAARALLAASGIEVKSCTVAIGGLWAGIVDYEYAEQDPLRAADPELAPKMAELVTAARKSGDSIGGVVEVTAIGVSPGLGDPVFDKLDAALGGALLSIGGVKGVEVGDGFQSAGRKGSENNDQMDEHGFLSNRCGGVLGGISNGEPIVLRLAVKPTPSISLGQSTQDLEGKARRIEIKGRHDPCLCPRVAPVAEAMTALVLADAWLAQRALRGGAT